MHTEIALSLLAAFDGREIMMRLSARRSRVGGLCGSTETRAKGRVVNAQEMYRSNDYIR